MPVAKGDPAKLEAYARHNLQTGGARHWAGTPNPGDGSAPSGLTTEQTVCDVSARTTIATGVRGAAMARQTAQLEQSCDFFAGEDWSEESEDVC